MCYILILLTKIETHGISKFGRGVYFVKIINAKGNATVKNVIKIDIHFYFY